MIQTFKLSCSGTIDFNQIQMSKLYKELTYSTATNLIKND